uniref:Zinc knuckle CX2CX4HX4C domain-containing protein n=1 Tax=Cannabis sativa TaxID=3483 RepID=A0A803PQH0_CANSA
MESFLPDISKALSAKEIEVVSLSCIAIPAQRPISHRLICRVYSQKGFNPKQLVNFFITHWKGRFDVFVSPYEMDSYMVTFGCEVHEDVLNEGWGPFLRIRVGIDVSKLLLRGQTIIFPWMDGELWLDYRYERLPDFCYEYGIIGHVFHKCPSFLEKLDEGKEPDLPYGPWLEGSSLPRPLYDRYRQDFSKSGSWPFITRLARNAIVPIISHPKPYPALPPSVNDREKGKSIVVDTDQVVADATNKIPCPDVDLYSIGSSSHGNVINVKNCSKELISLPNPNMSTEKVLHTSPDTNSSSSLEIIKECFPTFEVPDSSIRFSMPTPVAYAHVRPILVSNSPLQQDKTIPVHSTVVSSFPQVNLVQPISIASFTPGSSTGSDIRMSSLFSKR